MHCLVGATPDSASSCGSARGAPPGCSAACNYDRNNCIYTAFQPLERTLRTKEDDGVIMATIQLY